MSVVVRKSVQRFYDSVEMPGGYPFGHASTLRMIELYWNSRYKKGRYTKKGWRKFFYNIVKPTCDIASKFVDLDTKDIILVPEKSGDEIKVWLMQRRLRQWLKDVGFGDLLNEIGRDFPKYGTVVIKKAKNEWHNVQLINLRLDPSVETMKDSEFVYELHEMSKQDILDSGWSEAEGIEDIQESAEGIYTVYECYERSGKSWKREILSDPFLKSDKDGGTIQTKESKINKGQEFLPSIVLDKKRNAKFPYRELHWEKIPGRWLGLGFVEYLEDNQVAANEAENLERKGLFFTSMKLWQTRDEKIGGSNVLNNVESGHIFKIEQEITPLANEERDLAAFNSTRERWDQSTERKTFTTDITTGANLPSRTPLGVANLQAQLATSFFELKREQFGLFIKELIISDILPDFQGRNNKAHTLTFLGSDDELEKVDKAITRARVDKATESYVMRTGFFPSTLQMEDAKLRIEDSINRSTNRYLEVPEGFYTNARYTVDVLVTGESRDLAAQDSAMQFALQMLAIPGMMQNKTMRAILFKILGGRGISPADLDLLSENVDETPIATSGSLAAPTSQIPQATKFTEV